MNMTATKKKIATIKSKARMRVLAYGNKSLEGKLFVVIVERLYINRPNLTDLEIPPGSVIMFVEKSTYENELTKMGFRYTDMGSEQREWDSEEIFWQFLYGEEVFSLPRADAIDYLELCSTKKQAKALQGQAKK